MMKIERVIKTLYNWKIPGFFVRRVVENFKMNEALVL